MPARFVFFASLCLPSIALAQPTAGGGLVVKGVLGLLIVMSIAVWTIVIARLLFLRQVIKRNQTFEKQFWHNPDLVQIAKQAKHLNGTPFAELFHAGYQALKLSHRLAPGVSASARMPQIERVLKTELDDIMIHLEAWSGFLATTASAAPFIGLFGTVWGIMKSFQAIGAMQSASLSVVAPGLSEALIATATGLIAAIPAVVAYNIVMRQLDQIRVAGDSFSSRLLNVLSTLNTLPEA